jgi:hypothetical protein
MTLFRRFPPLRGTVVAGLLAAGILSAPTLAQRAYCQFGGCVNTVSGVSDPVMDGLIESTLPCTVDTVSSSALLGEGDIVQNTAASDELKVGASGYVTGQCNLRGWQPYPTNCANLGMEPRRIYYVAIRRLLPSGAQLPLAPYNLRTKGPTGQSIKRRLIV